MEIECICNSLPTPTIKKWEYVIQNNEYSCDCNRRHTVFDFSVLTKQEQEEKCCSLCGEKFTPHKKRIYYKICKVCGKKL